MLCPYCQTENRDDREACYYCKKDLSMLRLIVNKAKHHYNQGLEFAERGRVDDAIVELKNALDLDGSMDNAHVVLGTLYAKNEMFAEARESWSRALALNHNLDKAHEYLHKAEKAEYVYPAINRFKLITMSLSVALVAVGVIALWLTVLVMRRDINLERVRSTVAKLKEGDRDLSTLASELANIAHNRQATPVSRDLAEAIERHIQRDWQRRLDLASSASRAFNTYAAFQILDSVRKEDPTPEVSQSVNRLTKTAEENAITWIKESANFFFSGHLPYERFDFEARRFSDLMKDEAARKEVAQLLEKAKTLQGERQLSEAMEVITTADIVKAAQTLKDWESKNPQSAEPLRKAMEQRLATENANTGADVKNLIDEKQFDKAGARIEDLKLIYQASQRPLPAAQIATLASQIQVGRRRAAYETAMDAYVEKDWEKFLALTTDPRALTDDELEIAKINATRQEASDLNVKQTLAWFRGLEPAIKDGTLTAEDAAQAVKSYPIALERIELDPAITTATLCFDVASAHVKLGQPDKAVELLKYVVAISAKTSALGKTAAKLQKKLEDDLAKSAPAATGNAATSTTQIAPVATTPAKAAAEATPVAKAAGKTKDEKAPKKPAERQGSGKARPQGGE